MSTKDHAVAKKILIIDDEQDLVEIIKIRLSFEGYSVIWAYDGLKGLELAQNDSPDLIILDVMLPHLNGFAVCSLLKGHEQYRRIPVIILTARDEENDRFFDDDVKPDAMINKPFESETLIDKIKGFIGDP